MQQHFEEEKKECKKVKEENKHLIYHQAVLRSSNTECKREIKELKESQRGITNDDGSEINTLKQQLNGNHKEITTLKENCKNTSKDLRH